MEPFEQLHPAIRRWIRDGGWTELRDVQIRGIEAILGGAGDVIVAAATAAGKTEAAFLPVLTAVADRTEPGFSVLYVSPLKALINDQFRRLEDLCERLQLPVVRWHGDAPQSAKAKARRSPSGIALITPESIEAMLVRRPGDAERLLGSLDFVIIDELHAFLQGVRGLHLASLLRRIDLISAARARRVGLSATLGDFALAKQWLNPGLPETVSLLEAKADQPQLKLQIRGYVEPPSLPGKADPAKAPENTALRQMAGHMFGKLRGTNNLVFAGSRRTVEELSDQLRELSEQSQVPEEFFPHHGSLSRQLREDLEQRLKDGLLPTTAVATTTLELGIDLGSVESVAQVGAPRSLASLRQRLGRSGRRRGKPAILRIYLRENHIAPDAEPLDRLRASTVRAVAAIRLLVDKFVEPPSADPAAATVALHQSLSIIAAQGGTRADALYKAVCGEGPLSQITTRDYAKMLRGVSAAGVEMLEQAPDGTIMLGALGERIVAARDFYALFETDAEWRLVANGRLLGTVPIVNMFGIGSVISFAGRRWRVAAVDDIGKTLEVAPHDTGAVPKFDRPAVEPMHDRLAQEMRHVYLSNDIPAYLDPTAKIFLAEGRKAFAEYGLEMGSMATSGSDTQIFLWHGTEVNGLFAVMLTAAGLDCEPNDLGAMVLDCSPIQLRATIKAAGECPPTDDLADFVQNIQTAKFDEFLPNALLRDLWARRMDTRRGTVTRLMELLAA